MVSTRLHIERVFSSKHLAKLYQTLGKLMTWHSLFVAIPTIPVRERWAFLLPLCCRWDNTHILPRTQDEKEPELGLEPSDSQASLLNHCAFSSLQPQKAGIPRSEGSTDLSIAVNLVLVKGLAQYIFVF